VKIKSLLTLLVLGSVLSGGCVERKMVIRSEPAGAPVWVNEQYAGTTPLEHPFAHYGVNGLRVGPLRDRDDKITHLEVESTYDAVHPWYETIGIDFFAEVLYPGKLTDVHEVPVVVLPSAAEQPQQDLDRASDELIERADEYRQRALTPVPEGPPSP
jgi:hypothetical protein